MKILFLIKIKEINFFQCKNVQHSVCLNDRGASFGQPIGVSPCFRQVGFFIIILVLEALKNDELIIAKRAERLESTLFSI